MSLDHISLGPVPSDEEPIQVGSHDYVRRATAESEIYVDQLRRTFPSEQPGNRFGLKWNVHDFGSYVDVVVWYHPENDAEVSWAYHVERNSPKNWDAVAKEKLGGKGTIIYY